RRAIPVSGRKVEPILFQRRDYPSRRGQPVHPLGPRPWTLRRQRPEFVHDEHASRPGSLPREALAVAAVYDRRRSLTCWTAGAHRAPLQLPNDLLPAVWYGVIFVEFPMIKEVPIWRLLFSSMAFSILLT